MSSKDVAVSVRGLSKSYTIAHNSVQHTTAGEALLHRLRHPFQKAQRETFWALKDIDFDIHKGDVVGIIGRNGAGKSTLLKILSRITEPTAGEINLYGRVGSLLEVGTGFHPELTGRENIFLNGAILGMTRREIERQFDEIVDFAGVEQFLDTPVKRYSSGMYVRLAFAVAAFMRCEILVVDEVLAVGDAEFQKKCLGKMKDVSQSGRTVLFVSHNMGVVRQLCGTAFCIAGGQVVSKGQADTVIENYIANQDMQTSSRLSFQPNEYGLYVVQCVLTDKEGAYVGNVIRFGMPYQLVVSIGTTAQFTNAGVSILIRDLLGSIITSICPVAEGFGFTDIKSYVTVDIAFDAIGLYPGNYVVDVLIHGPYEKTEYLRAEAVLRFCVEPWCLQGATRHYERHHGYARIHSQVYIGFGVESR